MEYDFSQIDDKEFETLSAALLGKELGLRFERFKPGKDGGVDARCLITSDNEIIVQCKHYLKSGLARLLRDLKAIEKPKIDRLSPARYLVVTSCPLSRENKSSIRDCLEPHVKSDDDIFGPEDLNDILRRNESIEQAHPKLWMTSTAVLKKSFAAEYMDGVRLLSRTRGQDPSY